MKFYTYDQTNSGGGFDCDDNVAHYVIIEAEDGAIADMIAENIGVYFDGCDKDMDCPCCGDRWRRSYENEATDKPLIYGEPPEEFAGGTFNKEVIIYYNNG